MGLESPTFWDIRLRVAARSVTISHSLKSGSATSGSPDRCLQHDGVRAPRGGLRISALHLTPDACENGPDRPKLADQPSFKLLATLGRFTTKTRAMLSYDACCLLRSKRERASL